MNIAMFATLTTSTDSGNVFPRIQGYGRAIERKVLAERDIWSNRRSRRSRERWWRYGNCGLLRRYSQRRNVGYLAFGGACAFVWTASDGMIAAFGKFTCSYCPQSGASHLWSRGIARILMPFIEVNSDIYKTNMLKAKHSQKFYDDSIFLYTIYSLLCVFLISLSRHDNGWAISSNWSIPLPVV